MEDAYCAVMHSYILSKKSSHTIHVVFRLSSSLTQMCLPSAILCYLGKLGGMPSMPYSKWSTQTALYRADRAKITEAVSLPGYRKDNNG